MKSLFDKYGFRILIYIGIISFISYTVWFDYYWHERTKRRMEKAGWVFISEEEGHLSLNPSLRPWTVFKQPISHMSFAKKYDVARVDENRIAGHINRIERDGFETIFHESFALFNCKSNFIKLYENLDELKSDLNTKYESNSSIESIEFDYFCSKNVGKPYLMFDGFGREIDITNYIISDLYSIIDSSDNIINRLKNNNPYKPNESDEIAIEKGFELWLNQNYNLNINKFKEKLFTITNYKYSQMGFTTPLDVYGFEISIDGKKYLPEFWFSKISNPTNANKIDEVIFFPVSN